MSDGFNLLEEFKAGDEEKIAEYLSRVEDIDYLLNNGAGGPPLTMAWVAAFIEAPKALRMLIKAGANVEFFANDATVRRLCLIKPGSLPGLIEGGISPNAEELIVWFYSGFESEVPKSGFAELADGIIREVVVDQRATGISRKQIRASERFRQEYHEVHAALANMKSLRSVPEVKKLQRETEAALNTLASTLSDHVTRALSMLVGHPQVYETSVKQAFRGYRKNKKWLTEAHDRARQDICMHLSRALDTYEDDEGLATLVEIGLARYPIKQLMMGCDSPTTAPRCNGQAFELDAAEILERAGFDVRRVGGSGDQGADLIATKAGLSYAIQCKDYAAPVGNAAVQQALSAKAYYRTDYAVVCVPNGFTKSAKSLGTSAGVLLIKPSLLEDIEKLRVMVE